MSIIKSKHASNYTVLPNEIFKSGLSIESIGLLTYFLSLPHDWVIYKTQLHIQLDLGRDKLDRVFKELQNKGFVLSVKKHSESGRIEYEHIVYDKPYNGEPSMDTPPTEKPSTVNPPLQSTKELNTELESTKELNTELESTKELNNDNNFKTFGLSDMQLEMLQMKYPIFKQVPISELLAKFDFFLVGQSKSHNKQTEYSNHLFNWLGTVSGEKALNELQTKHKAEVLPSNWENMNTQQRRLWRENQQNKLTNKK